MKFSKAVAAVVCPLVVDKVNSGALVLGKRAEEQHE